jgi:hypothetical protein
LNCNGKCQLLKKIKQEEKKDKQNPERKADNKEQVLSFHSFFATLHFNFTEINTRYPASTGIKAVDMPQSIFHPPGA